VKLAVVGGGPAGTAAAWAARRAGVDVTVWHDRAGAAALYSGALDLDEWEHARPDAPLDPELQAFVAAFEPWAAGAASARVATYEGVLRPARGLDTALLELGALAGHTIAVADVRASGWNARALARSLSASLWADRTGTRFEPVAVEGVVDGAEAAASCFDVAELHDDAGRIARLAERLAAARPGADAWLVGPWLGTRAGAAERLREALGKPCGETTSPPGGPAGARFEAARDALLFAIGARVIPEHVGSIERRGHRFLPMGAASGSRTANDSGFDAIVLAVGGVASGGIVLHEGGETSGAGFRFGIDVDVPLGLDGHLLDAVSSVHGAELGAHGMGALERVGVLAEGFAVRGAPGLFVAGDAVAGRPRTALEAALAGILAAKRALQR
jgi:glycerol-3-phosphate dehydrogenase subunit B